MRIAILGGGFTGLSAAYHLLKKGHQVTIIEKESALGGLAIGFSQKGWDWTLEKAYHHWFTNDSEALELAQKIGHKVIIKRPKTNVYINKQILPLDSAESLIKFPYLSPVDRIKTGLSLLYLKLTNNYSQFDSIPALSWIRQKMGKKTAELIWEPLFKGKFGEYKEKISLTWFWARIKKRTPSLAYPEGGFQRFADKLQETIKKSGVEVLLNTQVLKVLDQKTVVKITLEKNGAEEKVYFDKVITTLPSPIFAKVTSDLPDEYLKKLVSVDHLHAQTLILVFDKPFFSDRTYWLNITDTTFPFLVLAEHTNFMDPKHYGNQYILYIGNYLPLDHSYLKLTADELLKIFDPFLQKINPNYQSSLISKHIFVAPYAQPVVTVGYGKNIATFKTPLKNVYLANMDMVYPWDRGTNYALEMGRKVADLITKNNV